MFSKENLAKEQWLFDQKDLFEEISLPLLFVEKILPKLSFQNLKVYLWLLAEEKKLALLAKKKAYRYLANRSKQKEEAMELFSLAEKADFPVQDLRTHLMELEALGLLRFLPRPEEEILEESLLSYALYFELIDVRFDHVWQEKKQSFGLEEKQRITLEEKQNFVLEEKPLASQEPEQNKEKSSASRSLGTEAVVDENKVSPQALSVQPFYTEEEKKAYHAFYQTLQSRFLNGQHKIGNWQQLLYRLYFEFSLEKEVIFQLFLEAEQKQAISTAYLQYMGELYYNEGVKTFSDLENFKDKQQKSQLFSKKLQKLLNRRSNFTQVEEKNIQKWLDQWKMQEEALFYLIEYLAMRKQNLTVHYLDVVIQSYYQKGISTLDALKKSMEDFEKERQQNKKSKLPSSKKASNVGNFKQRPYKALDEDPNYFGWMKYFPQEQQKEEGND